MFQNLSTTSKTELMRYESHENKIYTCPYSVQMNLNKKEVHKFCPNEFELKKIHIFCPNEIELIT